MDTHSKAPINPTAIQAALHAAITARANQTSGPAMADEEMMVVTERGAPNKIITAIVTPNDEQVQSQSEVPDHEVKMTSVSKFASTLWSAESLATAMTYNDWMKVSTVLKDAMPGVVNTETGASPLETRNPTDLPPIIAQQRLALLDSQGGPEHLQAKMELTEIAISGLYGEPINESIFSPDSLSETASWRYAVEQTDTGDLMEAGQDAEAEIRYIDSEIHGYSQQGLHTPPVILDERARLVQNTNEFSMQIDAIEAHLIRDNRLNRKEEADLLLGELIGEEPQNNGATPAKQDIMADLAKQSAIAYTLNDAESILKGRQQAQPNNDPGIDFDDDEDEPMSGPQ